MCGINGIICAKKRTDVLDRIKKMNESIIHRGPDSGGCVLLSNGRMALGQRRLAILDTSRRADQPMRSASGRMVLVYNGEIYNYMDLRRDLPYPFATNSDTEVLMAGIEREGIAWINQCNGMFVFACFDERTNSLMLARDRFGIKPLYYYHGGDVFVFSSEIKGILNSGLVKAEFNEEAIDEYLANRHVREPYTFFKNIYQVPAGYYMDVNEKLEISFSKYWELPSEFNMGNGCDEEELMDRFKDQVFQAVKRRMVSDVPLGTYLSGGIDSGIITAIVAMSADLPVNTYTIGFNHLNEFAHARQTAEKYRTRHHAILMEKENYFEMMGKLILYKDSPLGVPNEIPLALMSKELKKEITVVLSGEGADELLGGYGRIYRSPFDFTHVDKDAERDFYEYFIAKYEYVPRSMRDKYLTCGTPLRDVFDNRVRKEFENHPNESNVFRFFHNYHVKGLLQRVDITTMYASVEARVPFLDHQLVEFAYKDVPYDLKLKWNSKDAVKKAQVMGSAQYSESLDAPKYLLRKLGWGLLTKDVVEKKKMGFPVPLNEWFPELRSMAGDYLKNAQWFDCHKLDDMFGACIGSERKGQVVWMFLNVEIFRRLYFEKEWRY